MTKLYALEHRRSDNDEWQTTGTVFADRKVADKRATRLNDAHGPRDKYRVREMDAR